MESMEATVRNALLSLGTALALCASATTASASAFLVQLDDVVESGVAGNTYQDGNLIESVLFPNEQIDSSYGLWNGGLLSQSFDFAWNIFEHNGSLSDTVHIFGTQGQGSIFVTFLSDGDGQPLALLPNGLSIFETGGWQTFAAFDASNDFGSDYYVWQFRSDIETPEPGTIALIAVGLLTLLGIGTLRRHRDAKGQDVTGT